MKFFKEHQEQSTTAYLSLSPIQSPSFLYRFYVTFPIKSTKSLDAIREAFTKKIQAEEYGEFACSLTVFRSEADEFIRPGFSFDFRVYAWGEGEEDE